MNVHSVAKRKNGGLNIRNEWTLLTESRIILAGSAQSRMKTADSARRLSA
jgi:hypothetical protein